MQVWTEEQLKKLTGFSRPKEQAECLRRHKIYYVEGKDGVIRTTDAWIEQAGNDRSSVNDDGFQPDF